MKVFLLCGLCFGIPYSISKMYEINIDHLQIDYLLMFYGGVVYRDFLNVGG